MRNAILNGSGLGDYRKVILVNQHTGEKIVIRNYNEYFAFVHNGVSYEIYVTDVFEGTVSYEVIAVTGEGRTAWDAYWCDGHTAWDAVWAELRVVLG